MAASGKKQQHSDAVWANAFFEKKKKNCRVIENHFKLSPFIS